MICNLANKLTHINFSKFIQRVPNEQHGAIRTCSVRSLSGQASLHSPRKRILLSENTADTFTTNYHDWSVDTYCFRNQDITSTMNSWPAIRKELLCKIAEKPNQNTKNRGEEGKLKSKKGRVAFPIFALHTASQWIGKLVNCLEFYKIIFFGTLNCSRLRIFF